MTLWPFLLPALIAVAGFPLAYRWRRGHTGHPVIRTRYIVDRGPRRIGEYTTRWDAWRAARADMEE